MSGRARAAVAAAWCACLVAVCTGLGQTLRTDQEYWHSLARQELEEALQVTWDQSAARSVVLFVGDGMGAATVTAARVHLGGEGHRLAFEKFPHIGLLKTYSANKLVPDSSCSATALFCGVKANQETVGVDASVRARDCAASLQGSARLKSLAAKALRAGKSAGFVTTMRVTHATPAPLYAHSAHRNWECDANLPADAACKDHARQLVEDWPGRDLQVVMGGGRQVLVKNASAVDRSPWGCTRADGRDLLEAYRADKRSRGLRSAVVTNNQELRDLDVDNTDYLLGIFAEGHLPFEEERDAGPGGSPALADMVEAAIRVLRKNPKGYFLMVEGGNIDMAHHRGRARAAVAEVAALEAAVTRTATLTDAHTLTVVTSDHSHTLSINGYPYRGHDIFGIAGQSDFDGVNYTTLSYGTGGPGAVQYEVVNGSALRRDPGLNTSDTHFQQPAAIRLKENTHGGADVVIYAKGPHAHLFHSVHEQHYVYHAVCHAARLSRASAHAPHAGAILAAILAVRFISTIHY